MIYSIVHLFIMHMINRCLSEFQQTIEVQKTGPFQVLFRKSAAATESTSVWPGQWRHERDQSFAPLHSKSAAHGIFVGLQSALQTAFRLYYIQSLITRSLIF